MLNALIPILKEYNEGNGDPDNTKVVEYLPPKRLLEAVDFPLSTDVSKGGVSPTEIVAIVQQVLKYSVRTAHPRFFDKLYSGSDPTGQVAELITAVTNTNCHTYAVSPVYAVMEREVVKAMARVVGFQGAVDGLFCPGGSFSNLTAFVTARNTIFPGVKENGWLGLGVDPVCFCGSQAHYSIKRAAMICGIGTNRVVLVKTGRAGCMLAEDLDAKMRAAVEKGQTPFFVSTTAGTTVMGGFDPFQKVHQVCKKFGNVWMHVDAAWGGSLCMAENHRHLMLGAEQADSLVWNPHKALGIPVYTSVLFVHNHPGALQKSNSSGAEYLFHEHDASEYDLGDASLQCGRRADSLKMWLSWKRHGPRGLSSRIDKAMANALYFRDIVLRHSSFLLVAEPMFCAVCFWYVPLFLRRSGPQGGDVDMGETGTKFTPAPGKTFDALESITNKIYAKMQSRGNILVNFNPLPDHNLPSFFRIIVNSPNVEKEDLDFVLEEICTIGEEIEEEKKERSNS